MGRRLVSAVLLLLLIGALLAAPAQAKCCPLDRLVVVVPGFGGIPISADQLDSQLHPDEQGNLYWPVLNGTSKGDDRPAGNLGPRYDITYILEGIDGNSIQVLEKVYLEADPPVAFAPRGQTAELYPGDVRAVPWGWRPFPEQAANALLSLIDVGEVDATSGPRSVWPVGPILLGITVLGVSAGTAVLVLRRRRVRATA